MVILTSLALKSGLSKTSKSWALMHIMNTQEYRIFPCISLLHVLVEGVILTLKSRILNFWGQFLTSNRSRWQTIKPVRERSVKCLLRPDVCRHLAICFI